MYKRKAYDRLPSVIIISAALIFLVLSLIGINQLGLTYDECLFVNAALGGVTNDYVYIKILNIPFMTFFYEGALKAWLYYPIFKLFGVSMLSIRLPAILIAAACITVWYQNSKLIFKDSLYPLIFLPLIATDPAFIHHTNIEYNTIALHSLLIALTFHFYLRFLNDQSPRTLAWFFTAIILGIFNRFNFIWLAFSLITAGFIFDHKTIISAWKKNQTAILIRSGLFLAVVTTMSIFLIMPASKYPIGGSVHDMFSMYRLQFILFMLRETMSGNFPYLDLFNTTIPHLEIKNFIELSVTIMALLSIVVMRFTQPKNKFFLEARQKQLFFLTVCLIMLMVIILTPQARTSYHMLTMWPLPLIIFLLSFSMLSCLMNKKTGLKILLTLATIIFIMQLIVNYLYVSALYNNDTQLNPKWTTAVYTLSSYVNKHANEYDEILSLNFGINNQIAALSNNNNLRKKLHEDAWCTLLRHPIWINMRNMYNPAYNRADADNIAALYENFFKNKKVLIIRAPSVEPTTDAIDFPLFAAQHDITITQLPSITDKNGYPIYFLYTAMDTNRR